MIRLALLLLLLCAGTAVAAQPPAHVRIQYQVSIGPLKIGEGTDSFDLEGGHYQVVSESKTTGMAAALYRFLLRRESHGDVVGRSLRPRLFTEKRNSNPVRRAQFDWEAGTLSLDEGGEHRETVPLPAHTWDSTSFAYNFCLTPPTGSELEVHITDGRRLTAYRYAILGRERIHSALGELETLHVKKVQDEDDKRAFEVWLAVEHHHLPVRIRYTEKDGTAIESLVTAITYPGR